ncbi:delta-aminolevulinic acid dehydratase [Seongchinamella unica]|uniref:Delta-aminolevulinic acid dehydratase n=1 Tax=Seongchinamella unica TaxID=2547392 RepID=A0A4R5LQN7_9GAMM|nr:delta-aminolevulinic acid dehydratase [Seongchinamella unica]TDG12878.1 delta-aminolevulinic acid dehydratase [Seongchinamella unica]
MSSSESSFTSLMEYCEKEGYKGWDPYDGLNSKIFQATPLRNWDVARLVLIQGCKRSPINFRPILRIPKEYNAKGVGLFLNGYCNLYAMALAGDSRFGQPVDHLSKINMLAELLLSLRSEGYSGACWGYNFDWQARRLFLFPAYTPTVVATAFCASALFSAYEATGNQKYLDVAISSGDFVLKDLNRSACKGGFMLSYSPIPGNDTVYNASLLGAKLLSYCYRYTQNVRYKDAASEIVSAACAGQEADGSWVYGLLPIQSWKDSFHTGYNLDAISHYSTFCDDSSFDVYMEKGLYYYIDNFFESNGTPKYYHDKVYPIDIHCPAQLWVTLSVLGKWEDNEALCGRVMEWTIRNMQDQAGYFYYQLKRGLSSKIPYMRWSNAFMFNAMSYYLLETHGK